MAEVIKNTLTKILVSFCIFLMVTVWIFSGWPRIWPLDELGTSKIRIPPEVKEVEAATEDLHADGAGANNTFTGVTQANLATNDNDTTKALGTAKTEFLYATITNTSTCSGTVNSVTAKIYAFSSTSGMTQAIGMYDGTTAVYGSQEQPSTNSAAYSYHGYTRTANPAGGAWTCADVDNLQVTVDPDKSGAPSGDWRVTELWITVDYTPAPTLDITAPSNVQMPNYTLGGVGYADRNFQDVSALVQVTASAGFTVTVSSTNLTGTNNTISNANVRLRTDGTASTNPTVITSCTGFSGITETANGEYSLDSTRTIVTTSSGSGTCDIYPTIRVYINNYNIYVEQDTGTLTFTVTSP